MRMWHSDVFSYFSKNAVYPMFHIYDAMSKYVKWHVDILEYLVWPSTYIKNHAINVLVNERFVTADSIKIGLIFSQSFLSFTGEQLANIWHKLKY